MHIYDKNNHLYSQYIANYDIFKYFRIFTKMYEGSVTFTHLYMATRNQRYVTIIYQCKGIFTSYHPKKTDLKNIDLEKSYVEFSGVKKCLL